MRAVHTCSTGGGGEGSTHMQYGGMKAVHTRSTRRGGLRAVNTRSTGRGGEGSTHTNRQSKFVGNIFDNFSPAL